jgi:hypothetical protein
MNSENTSNNTASKYTSEEMLENLTYVIVRLREDQNKLHEINEKAISDADETFGFVSRSNIAYDV